MAHISSSSYMPTGYMATYIILSLVIGPVRPKWCTNSTPRGAYITANVLRYWFFLLSNIFFISIPPGNPTHPHLSEMKHVGAQHWHINVLGWREKKQLIFFWKLCTKRALNSQGRHAVANCKFLRFIHCITSHTSLKQLVLGMAIDQFGCFSFELLFLWVVDVCFFIITKSW